MNDSYFERVRIGNVYSVNSGITYMEGESEDTVWNGEVIVVSCHSGTCYSLNQFEAVLGNHSLKNL